MNYSIKKISLLITLASLALGACQKDFLDRKPLNLVSEETVWNDPALIKLSVNEFYTFMPTGFTNTYLPSAITDEVQLIGTEERKINTYLTGDFLNSSFPDRNLWRDYYAQIRKINYFLERAEKSQILNTQDKNLVMGQARFFRAYLYFQLFSNFQEVPLITKVQTSDQADQKVEKATLQAGITFIAKELATAATELPDTYSKDEWGRISKQAALAYQSRVLLWWASPLNNSTQESARWEAAAKSANAVISSGVFDLQQDYSQPFLVKNVMTKPEVILEVRYNGLKGQKQHAFDKNNSAVGFGGKGINCPTQEMVDAYEMRNGKMIHEQGSGYDPIDPFKDRDPRLAKSVVYNGSSFKGRIVELYVGGKDMPTASASPTGYYIRKFIDEKFDYNADATVGSSTNWIVMRYAEVLLNYAEAQNELEGPTAEVYSAVNRVRKRAGMPNLPAALSQTQMRTRILHERRVELAFEDNIRYQDLKRNKQAEQVLNGDLHGVSTRRNVDGTFTVTSKVAGKRLFEPRHYWMPIPLTELAINTNLQPQNPGW